MTAILEFKMAANWVVESIGAGDIWIQDVKIPLHTKFQYHMSFRTQVRHIDDLHGGHFEIQDGGRLSDQFDGGRQYFNSGCQNTIAYQISIPHVI